MTGLEIFLALFWGLIWAAFLQFFRLGRFLADKRTWVAVVIGVGGDLAIAFFCVSWDAWSRVAGIVLASSAGIILRSLYNEQNEQDRTRPRLPNKVQWNLDDISDGIYLRMAGTLREMEQRAQASNDWQWIASTALIGRDLETIRRRARDARRGEYEL